MLIAKWMVLRGIFIDKFYVDSTDLPPFLLL